MKIQSRIDLTLKKMFDISEKLVSEQEEINNLDKISWKNHWWRADWIRVEHLPRIHNVAAVRQKKWSTERLGTKLQKLSQEEFYLCRCSTTFPVTVKAMKKNVWQMPKSSPYLQRNLVLDSGHSLVQVPKRNDLLWKRIAPKEVGIKSRTRCCWNSQKADVLFFVQRLHCTGVSSKVKRHGKLSIHFAADEFTIETIFRIIRSVSQLRIYGAVATICEEFENHQDGWRNLRFWWVNLLFSVKLRQKLLCRMKTLQIIKFYDANTKNELNHFHWKAKWVDSVWRQDFCVLLKWDSISWARTLVILDNFVQWLVANTLFSEMIQLLNPKDGFKEIWGLILYWKSQPVFSISNMELKFELSPWIKTILILGSEISYGTVQYVIDSVQNNTEILADPQEEQIPQTSIKVVAARSKAKTKTTTKRPCWYAKNHTNTPKKMDWHWAIRTNSRCVRCLEESGQSSSTQSYSTAGRRWSNSILENDEISSSKSILTSTALVGWALEILFRSRRLLEKSFMETAVIDWWRIRYQSSTHKSLRLLRFCVVPWKSPSTSGIQRSLEEKDWMDHNWSKLQRLWRYAINGEPTEFEWNIFPGFTTLQLCGKKMIYWATWDKHQKFSQEEFYLCRCSTTFPVTVKAMKKNVWQMPKSVSILAKKFGIGQWSFIGPGSEKKWSSMEENSA